MSGLLGRPPHAEAPVSARVSGPASRLVHPCRASAARAAKTSRSVVLWIFRSRHLTLDKLGITPKGGGLGNRRNRGMHARWGCAPARDETVAQSQLAFLATTAPPFHRGGHTRFGWACSSRVRRARANNVRTHGVPARARAGPAFARQTSEIRALQAFSGSPLTDSNRRPPPYHFGVRATGGNPRQRLSCV